MIQMLSRTTVLALMIAFGAVACAPPALDADHASNSSAASGSGTSSKGKSKSKSKTSTKDQADDDDDTSGDDDDSTGTTTKGASKGTTPATTNGGGAATPETSTAAPASFAAVYSGLKGSCGSCHLSGAGGAPVFFGDTAATSYPQFKDMNFATDPSPLSTKGAHSGPALTAQQDSAISAWVAAEQ